MFYFILFYFIFFGSVMKNSVFNFEKDLLFTINQVFCLKRSKLERPFCFSLKFCPFVYKKVFRKLYFSESVDLKNTKRKQNKKIHTQVFRQCYVQHMGKISGKNSKPYFSWSSQKLSSYKQETRFLVRTSIYQKSLTSTCLLQNQYNQTTTVVLKSNIHVVTLT